MRKANQLEPMSTRKINKAASHLTRRDFLKVAGLGLGGLAFLPWESKSSSTVNFPQGDQLGRVTVGKTELKSRPDADSQTVGDVYEDMVVIWLRESVGRNPLRINQRWVETPDGYIWAPYLQPVRNSLNIPLTALPAPNGMWVEVTIPYIDLTLENPPARSPGLVDRLALGLPPRLYYSQVVWVDQMQTDDQGQVWYRGNERYGSYGDILWAAADAFRPLTAEEIAPLHPDVEDKRVVVNVVYQTLSC